MARTELMGKSVSRHTLLESLKGKRNASLAQTARAITTPGLHGGWGGEETALPRRAMETYAAYTDRLYAQGGVGDIGVAEVREKALLKSV